MQQAIAVIGAGMSGMACADALAKSGAKVTVFDKGRALGGRMATRDAGRWSFDHGAPSFHAQGTALSHCLEYLVAKSSARRIDGSAHLYAGNPQINKLLTPLATGVDVRQSVEISQIELTPSGWRLSSNTEHVREQFDTLLICIPAPQARIFIAPIAGGWASLIDGVEYDPCLTMLLARTRLSRDLCDYHFEGHPVLNKQIRQRAANAAGEPTSDAWVVHATPAWSKQNLDRDRQEIAQLMLQEFVAANGLSDTETAYLRGHRWRYARVNKPLGEACLWNAETRLGLAGDWCLGASVEHAFTSGVSLAARALGDPC